MNLDELRLDCAITQKKGIHFIIASIFIWIAVTVIHLTSLPILTKNFYTFCATAPLMPIAFVISKLIKVDFTHKSNPLTKLGMLFSLNQILYLIIAMWVYSTSPKHMVMVLAIIFGSHLLPYGWLYKSLSYKIISVFVSIAALIIGVIFEPYVLAITMVAIEIIFSGLLYLEVKRLPKLEKKEHIA